MSAVGEVMTRLVALAQAALPEVQVLDGFDGDLSTLERMTLFLGYAPTPGAADVISEVAVEDELGGLCATVETVTVACTASIFDGDFTFASKRSELVDLLSTLRTAIVADRKLDGFAYDTWLAPTAQWYNDVVALTDGGPSMATVQVDFAVTATVLADL